MDAWNAPAAVEIGRGSSLRRRGPAGVDVAVVDGREAIFLRDFVVALLVTRFGVKLQLPSGD